MSASSASTPPLHGLFVTGTDTGVGKSHVTASLLQALAGAGWRVGGLKPLAAGLPSAAPGATDTAGAMGASSPAGPWGINEDVALLAAHGNALHDPALVGPCGWPEPCAPHVAARLAGERIAPDRVMAGIARAAQAVRGAPDPAPRAAADAVTQAAGPTPGRALLVEGVGGFVVPLSDDDAPAWDTADLAVTLGLPVVLVVGLRLGCLNHALLTAEAIAARGLRLAGWIANRPQAEPMAHEADTVATLAHWLARRHGTACWGVLPFDPAPAAADRAAAALDVEAIGRTVAASRWSTA